MNRHCRWRIISWLGLAALLAAGSGLPVRAATIAWSKPVTISADTNVVVTGTLVGAYAAGSEVAVGPINGVTFVPWAKKTTTDGRVTTTIGVPASAFADGAAGSQPFAALSTSYQTLLTSGLYDDSPGKATVTLTNLTVGTRYLVQFWVNESRGGCCYTRSEKLDGKATLEFNVVQENGGVGQYITGTFTADATSQVIQIVADESAQINALQLRSLPAETP